METAENNFAVMTASQFWPEYVITSVVIAADVGDETTLNALVQVPLSLHSKLNLLDEQTTPTFQTLCNPNKDLVSEFCFSRKFNDRL